MLQHDVPREREVEAVDHGVEHHERVAGEVLRGHRQSLDADDHHQPRERDERASGEPGPPGLTPAEHREQRGEQRDRREQHRIGQKPGHQLRHPQGHIGPDLRLAIAGVGEDAAALAEQIEQLQHHHQHQ